MLHWGKTKTKQQLESQAMKTTWNSKLFFKLLQKYVNGSHFSCQQCKIKRSSNSGHICLFKEFGNSTATGAMSLGLLNCLFLQSTGTLKQMCFTCICHLAKLVYSRMVYISSTCAHQHVLTIKLFWALKGVKELVRYQNRMTRPKYNIAWLTLGAQFYKLDLLTAHI